jgi:cytochrome c-type biogenesis protein CcmH/NrfF
LRETQHGLNVDIERLDSRLKAVNIAVAPLIVAVVGGFVLASRRRRRSRGAAQTRLSPAESSSR